MGRHFKDTKDWKLRGERRPKILYLCEGEAETEYVDTWLTNRNADINNIWIFCFRGLSQIDAKISILIKEPNFHNVNTICVFLDAEDNFDQRIRDVKKMLRIMDFPHSAYSSVPWVETDNGKKSCVFISPDMNSSGRIENIVMNELRDKKNIFNCLDNFNECSVNAGIENFDDKKYVNSYITMNHVGIGLGAAFKKGLFNLSHSAYAQINDLLEEALE